MGQVSLIDKDDLDIVKDYGWYSNYKKSTNSYYAKTEINNKAISMHRLILDAPKDKQVDHVDHNGLNNRKSNLRLCNQSENSRNKRMQSNNTSGFRGAYLEKKTGKYKARIMVNRKQMYLGSYETAKEASDVYQEAAKRLHGKFYCK